jgi:hypothetical protein
LKGRYEEQKKYEAHIAAEGRYGIELMEEGAIAMQGSVAAQCAK